MKAIIKELENNGISEEMIYFFKTSKWLVLADIDKEIIGAAGIGGSFNVFRSGDQERISR